MTESDPSYKLGKNHSGFFSVDLGAFRCAVAAGLNPAIAHLIMARGTGRENRITSWSVNAIEKRTGISRPNAKKAVGILVERGIWHKTRGGKHPVYESNPGDQVKGGPFTPDENLALDQIRTRSRLLNVCTAEQFVARGLASELPRSNSRRLFKLNEEQIKALVEPKHVWLPNALIDGAADEVPPIELIRQTRNLMALQLLVEIYAIQFLPD
ncbi:MAG: hypothetical protein WCK17_10830, partial [Verrucomicrobiota bacterium]